MVLRNPPAAVGANGQIIYEIFEGRNSVPVYYTSQPIGATAPPYNFTITVSSSTFKATSTYTLRATIAEGTVTRAQGSTPVINGGSTTLSIVALPANGTLPTAGSDELFLLIGLLLAIIAGALLLWRELRLRRNTQLPA
jgi:hypothetical protein